MQDWVRESITQDGEVSLATSRHFQTSRKYASATLEYFDSIGFTYRKGDVRVKDSTIDLTSKLKRRKLVMTFKVLITDGLESVDST